MSTEKKIIIDEDWKSQVQAEQEAAKQEHGAPASAGGPVVPDAASAPPRDAPMPAASFEMLVTTLATEALVALGQVPHPATGKAVLERNHAQYLIDTLDVLRQKTQGNLTADEQQLIDEVLHQMRMLFVAVASPGSASVHEA